MAQALLKNSYGIEQKVQQEIRGIPQAGANAVMVETGNGRVTLTGTVDTYPAKLEAGDAARHAAGLMKVVNNIQVRRSPYGFPADVEIGDAVRQNLKWNRLVPHEKIEVVVEDGYVILEGEIPYQRQKQEAEHSIATILGVRGIINRIRVRLLE